MSEIEMEKLIAKLNACELMTLEDLIAAERINRFHSALHKSLVEFGFKAKTNLEVIGKAGKNVTIDVAA
jgi:hypothetical protein